MAWHRICVVNRFSYSEELGEENSEYVSLFYVFLASYLPTQHSVHKHSLK